MHYLGRAGRAGTANTVAHWQHILGSEAVSRSLFAIRLVGPWVEGEYWPSNLPHGGVDAPYTELVRFYGDVQAPCYVAFSGYRAYPAP